MVVFAIMAKTQYIVFTWYFSNDYNEWISFKKLFLMANVGLRNLELGNQKSWLLPNG